MSFQFGDNLNLVLITNNLSNQRRTLKMTLTLQRINSFAQSISILKEHNQISSHNQYTGPQTPHQSVVQIFRLDYNQRR